MWVRSGMTLCVMIALVLVASACGDTPSAQDGPGTVDEGPQIVEIVSVRATYPLEEALEGRITDIQVSSVLILLADGETARAEVDVLESDLPALLNGNVVRVKAYAEERETGWVVTGVVE